MTKGTILVESKTRRMLKELGKKEMTYDQVINELIQSKEKERRMPDGKVESLTSSKSSRS